MFISINRDQYDALNAIRLNKYLNFGADPKVTTIPVGIPVLGELNVDLRNSTFTTFEIQDIGQADLLLKTKEIGRPACQTLFDGFNVTNLNETSFKFFFMCIDNQFRSSSDLAFDLTKGYQSTEDHCNKEENQLKYGGKLKCIIDDRIKVNKESNKRLLDLLDSLEKLATLSEQLGAFTVQREIQYRQKKLEFFITKTNFELAKINIAKSFLGDEEGNEDIELGREIGRAYISFGQLVSLSLQDLINGYGFYRENVFFILFYLFTTNFFLALWIKHKKQQTLAIKSLYLKTREIKDENLHNICPDNRAEEGIESIRENIDIMARLIFHKAKTENGKRYFYLYYKLNNNEENFKQIKLVANDFEYLINILDERNPHHTKVGFCRDYYPRGQWSVVTKPIYLDAHDNHKEEIHEISLYLINKSEEIIERQFDYLPWPRMAINWSRKFISPVIKIVEKLIVGKSLQTPKTSGEVVRKSIRILISIPLLLLVVFLLSGFFPVSLGNCTKIWFWFYLRIKYYFMLITFVIILTLVIDSWQFFEKSYQKETGGNYSYITKKNIENSLLFSLDILLPFIEIDKENQEFILNAAEDYMIIRTIFKLEKVVGPVLISLILPLLFITGL